MHYSKSSLYFFIFLCNAVTNTHCASRSTQTPYNRYHDENHIFDSAQDSKFHISSRSTADRVEKTDLELFCPLCCCCMAVACLACLPPKTEISPCSVPVFSPQCFKKNYQPLFEGLDHADALAQRYCPDFLKAAPEEQKMIDINPACTGLSTLKERSNQHHSRLLKEIADRTPLVFKEHHREYNDTVRQSIKEHQHNIEQITLAKQKCGCPYESKKTK